MRGFGLGRCRVAAGLVLEPGLSYASAARLPGISSSAVNQILRRQKEGESGVKSDAY
ncbi:MAG: hypothetical protein HGA46_01235 [Chlorobiaceae bacterium]|nr:hypothetical protein [Chlorobiaceae bacterium]